MSQSHNSEIKVRILGFKKMGGQVSIPSHLALQNMEPENELKNDSVSNAAL